MKSFRKNLKEGSYGRIHASIHAPYQFDESLLEAFSTPDEIKSQRELASRLTQHYSGLLTNKTHSDAIKNYTSSSNETNNFLWKSSPHNRDKDNIFGTNYSIIKPKIKILDKALSLYKTPHPLTVWSSTTHNPMVERGDSDYVHHPAFLSTTIDKSVAINRDINSTRNKNGDSHHHILHINVPEGHNGAYIDHISSLRGEREFLLPRGLNMRYHRTESTKIPMKDYYTGKMVHKFTHIHHMSLDPTT